MQKYFDNGNQISVIVIGSPASEPWSFKDGMPWIWHIIKNMKLQKLHIRTAEQCFYFQHDMLFLCFTAIDLESQH